jgi:methylenetetrahydrofolate dehydrogenase (NADP+)/methenyltetrahydrofolate cyclohydrolase
VAARLLDGAAAALDIRCSLGPRVDAFRRRAGRAPALAIVLAGENPASEIYVRNKVRAAAEVGIEVDLRRLPASADLRDLLALIDRLNDSSGHDGILVQAPLPGGMGGAAVRRVFDAIDPAKDVDGFSPENVGRLVQNRATLTPCTPTGILDLLDREGIPIAGSRAVVLGRSDIVGKPMALLLLHRDATVTVCHSRTRALPDVTREADILVAAIGRAGFVTPDFVRPGATVVDVGINRVTDPARVEALLGAGSARRAEFERRGSIVVGDVHPAVAGVAGALSPVPGGVGPLTVAVLLRNTMTAAEARLADASGPADAGPHDPSRF